MLIPVAIGLAWWFKQRYAKAIVRLQAGAATSSAPAPAEPAPPLAPNEPAPPLTMQLIPAATLTALDGDVTADARRIRGRVLRMQFVLGLVYWIVIEIVIATGLAIYNSAAPTESPDTFSGWGTALMSLPVVCVPPLLAWALQAGTRESTAWWIIAAGAVSVGAGLALNGQGWIAVAVTPLLLALLGLAMPAFLRPAVRGAGPPLIAAMLVAFLAFCVLGLIAIAVEGDSSTSEPWTLGDVAVLLVAIALCAWIGWRMLLRISRRYAQKRFSELQLALGSYWGLMTLFTMASIMMIAFEEKTGATAEWIGLAIALTWLVWRVIQRLGLRFAVRRAQPALPPLLLLRVFKPSSRSEAFMDRLLARWRFVAPAWMTDLREYTPNRAGTRYELQELLRRAPLDDRRT